MDVDLGDEQSSQNLFEVTFVGDLDCQHVAFAKWKVIVDHQLSRFVRIVDDQAYNRTVRRIEDGESNDVNIVRFEQGGEVVEAANPIFRENRELLYGITGSGGGDVHCRKAVQRATGADMGQSSAERLICK